MRRLRHGFGAALAASAFAGALAGAAAPAATAADGCPNADVRAQQGSQYLPDCRAFERVTPNEDRGSKPDTIGHFAHDGSAVMFWGTSPVLSAAGAGNRGVAVARRTASGWVHENADPGFGTRRYQGVVELQRPGAASSDLTRSLYGGSYPWDPDDQGVGNFRVSQTQDVYRREPNGTMTWITKPLDLPHTAGQGATLLAESADLSRIAFRTVRRMTTDTVGANTWNLYLHVDGQPIRLVSRGTDDAVLPGGTDEMSIGSVAMSHSGHRLTFNVGGVQYVRHNVDDPSQAQTKLFTTAIHEITGQTCSSPSSFEAPSGREYSGLLRFSCQERLTDDGHTTGTGTYVYDLEAETISYVDPAAPTPDPVFFVTDAALVPEDQNGVDDVYQRVDGAPRLITTGTSPHPAELMRSTADGESVFIHTAESLVADDQDSGNFDIYVARRNGGFLQPDPAPEPCKVNCQGDVVSAPVVPTIASLSFVGSGNVLDVDPSAAVQPMRATVPAKAATGSSASLKVRVAGAGEVRVSGSGLRATTKRASKAGSVSLTVRLSQHSRTLLTRKGQVSAVAKVRFVPSVGKSQTQRVRLTFKRASKKQGASRAGAVRSASNGKGGR